MVRRSPPSLAGGTRGPSWRSTRTCRLSLSTRARATVASDAARPSAPRTLSLWHWPEITPSIGCTWATGVLLQAARAKQTAAVAMACFMEAFLV